MIAGALLGRISMGEYQDHAGRSLRHIRIDGIDSSLADRGFDDEAISRLRTLLEFVGVESAACDLEPTVDAIERLADDALRTDIERVKSYGSVHFHWACLLRSESLQPERRAACGA